VSNGWERWAARAARSVERRFDEVKTRLGDAGARQVVAYRGFGTRAEVFVSGRVLNNNAPSQVDASDAWWRNLARAFAHLESDEVPGARVRLTFSGAQREAVTDDEGFYRAWLKPADVPTGSSWLPVDVEVLDHLHPSSSSVKDTGRVLIPDDAAEFGVISDLDDTVIRTDATRLLRMLKRTLLENARTRTPFEGVARFYEGLHGGRGHALNPIFYVSSSPWNLYSVLTEFLEIQDIPLGPIMLRDWGVTERGVLPMGHGEHKLGAIRQIMDCYPSLPFILIGDSGQEDPEIYTEVVRSYSNRILAIYIRNVTTDPLRSTAIRKLAEEVRSAGSELLLSDDTLASAQHAAAKGWISARSVADVAAAVNGTSPA